ncbi:MAG TPA: HD domain-containing protein [Polyangia bacterium]|jgi:tRNA nucleotidyltransferase (CCA-adding enzyme)
MSDFPRDALPDDVVALCRRLRAAGHAVFVVGGAIRDVLLGRAPHEFDVATSATPEEVTAVFGRRHTLPIGIKHGTVTVLFGDGADRRPVEVTTFRGEGAYVDGRRPESVTFLRDIREDLGRRDFTINAMAYDPVGDELVDPHGGRADLAARLIRAVGVPLERFQEDGLRCLRAVRFATTLEMRLDEATKAAVPAALDTVRKVSAERVREELNKLLVGPRPSVGLELMRETGLMGVVIPELLEGYGQPQNRFHRHDVWYHTLMTVDATPPVLLLRWAALLHDVGKPRTAQEREDAPGEHSFFRHEHVGAELADAILRRLKLPNADRELIVHLVAQHMYYYTGDWSPQAVRRFLRRVGPEHVDDLLALRAADIRGFGRDEDPDREIAPLRARIEEALREDAALKVSDLAIGGADVMQALGVEPGPVIGKVLNRLLERVIDDPSLNTRERLLALVPEVAAEGA